MDLPSWFPTRRRWQEPVDQAAGQTLQLHLDSLKLRFGLIDSDALADRDKPKHAQIRALFGGEGVEALSSDTSHLSWDDAFRLESQIGSLLQGDRLRQEISARLRWAATDGVPQFGLLQSAYTDLLKLIADQPSKDPDALLRDFLLQVMESIHWHSKRKHLTRKMRGQATRRTLLLGMVALLLTLWPYLILTSSVPSPTKGATPAAMQAVHLVSAAVFSYDISTHFALYTSVAFGFLGALFSRLITLQRQWSVMALDELFNARAYHYIILRASIGILGALIVYFFLQSGLVEGKVFPNFKGLSMNLSPPSLEASGSRWPSTLLLPSADLALLIVWSFVAGFSESLVPTVLSGAERQFSGALAPRQ